MTSKARRIVVGVFVLLAVAAAVTAWLLPPLYPPDRPAGQIVVMQLPIPYGRVRNCYTSFEIPDSVDELTLEVACDSETVHLETYEIVLSDPNGREVLRETGSFAVNGEVPLLVPGGGVWRSGRWVAIDPVEGLYRLSVEGNLQSGKNARAVVVGRSSPQQPTSRPSSPATSEK